ncbi:LysR family transcriptional regulator [Bradyrhizobium erythrophlei]|uniref:LysR family transcriptional regulator n=1 Tax=Bradyrhizobium erythrophlei TaxID=1437360 RepID=UPI0035EC196C
MKLHDLHVLMTVAQAGSMNKAATLLNTTQPAVSRSIAELEHTLGVRLLDRYQHGVAPTAYGRALLDRCATAFDELRQGVKNIEHLADPTAGEVRIGATAALDAGFVPAVVDRLSRRHPRIIFHVVGEDSEALHRELHERNLDFLIVRKSPAADDERLNFETLFSDTYVVAAGLQHPSSRRRRITLAELADECWAMPLPGSTAASIAREAFRASGVDFPRAPVFARPEARMNLVTTGRFLSIFSELRLFLTQSPMKVLPVELPTAPVPSGIVTLKNRTLSPVAQLFIDAARQIAKPLAKKI